MQSSERQAGTTPVAETRPRLGETDDVTKSGWDARGRAPTRSRLARWVLQDLCQHRARELPRSVAAP
jgi:hypothetical protein